jgi:peptidoglycan glycosyltransferase
VIDTFAAACPRPFVDAFSRLPLPADSLIRAFGLLEAPTLTKFGTVTGKNPTALASLNIPARRLAQASGQGDLTVTPLQMALLAATIANDGTTITPYLVDAIRPADMPWQAQDRVKDQQAVITRETAQQLRLAMRAAVDYGSARAAQPATPASGAEVYGHASIAYTGINSNAWFIGFTFRPDGSAVAVAVVVEGKADTALASQIGGAALQAARK